MFRLITFLSLHLVFISVCADEVNISGRIGSNTRYIDNYYMDDRDVSVTEEKVTGQVAVESNTEQYKNKLSVNADAFINSEGNKSNDVNYHVNYNFEKQTELNIFALDLAYSETSDRDSQIDNDERVTDSTRKNSNIGLNWLTRFSERMDLESNLSIQNTRYSDSSSIGNQNTRLSSFLNYQLTPRLSLNTGLYSYYYKPDDGVLNNVLHYSAVFGGSYQFSEKWSMNGKTSFGRTRSDFISQLGLSDSTSNAKQYLLDLTYDAEVDSFSLNGSRLEEPDNNGDIQTIDRLGINYRRSLSETRSLSLGLSWRKSEDNNIGEIIDTRDHYYNFNLSMGWQISNNISSNIFYQYQLRDQRSEDFDSNSVGVDISYHWY